MIYPEFPVKHDLLGISAPSAGVGKKLEQFDRSLSILRKNGYRLLETEHVRVDDPRGGTAQQRGEEFSSLFRNPEVKAVVSAAGGDFLFEVLPYIDWNAVRRNPKWITGASDPTSILFTTTVKYDIATIYGFNAGSFDETPLMAHSKNALRLFKGESIVQKSSRFYASKPPFAEDYAGLDTPNEWKSTVPELSVSGRCIGGCVDVLKDLIGTRYDAVKAFVRRYQEDGFIWYFDNFSLSAEVFYRTMLQMQYAGWFAHAKAVLIGRVLFPSSETGMTYDEAINRAFPSIPVIYDADIGHTVPKFTMINGAVANLEYKKQKGSISFELK